MKFLGTLGLMFILLLPCFSLAQEPKPATPTAAADTAAAVPVLSSEDSLKVANALLSAENIQLKQAQLAADLERAKTAFTALMKSLEKPGFVLQRTADGAFVYVAEAPKPGK